MGIATFTNIFRHLRHIGAGLLTLSALTGCTVNPVTGESQFSILSAAQEVSLGTKQYGPSQQSQGGRYSVDPELSLYVSNVGRKLAAVSGRPNLPYEFVVLNNDTPNAWALPGGKIAINRGLLSHLQDEAQLAAVLSHEIVHAAARHSAQQMTRGMLLGLGGQIATIAGQQAGYGQLANTGVQLGSALFQAHYGRDQELEADRYGMLYMSRAGYEPEAAIELQKTFVQLSQGRQSNPLQTLFASHPPSQARVEANQQHAAKLTPGVRNNRAFKHALAQITRDQPAYEQHLQAITAVNNKDFDKARSLLNSAIKQQPREPLFLITQGQLQLDKQEFKAALNSFTRAHKANPEYFMPLLGSGMAAQKLNYLTRAEQDFLASSALLPTQSASFYLGEIKLKQGEKNAAIGYFRQAVQGGGELGKLSQVYLLKLMPSQEESREER